jgi:DNA-binding transcriptional MerR regulator
MADSTQKAYKIGDFAKKMGVSSHFLKYYEEAGILKPTVHENGYRFYSLYDSSVILECKRLKNLGFSVREMRTLMTESSIQDVRQQLAEREKMLAEEIDRKELLLQTSKNLRATLDLCEAQEWRIVTAPDMWFLPHTLGQNFLDEDALYPQLEQWMECMPMVCSAHLLTRAQEDWQGQWGLCVEASDAERMGLKPQPPAYRLPRKRVFEQYLKSPAGTDTSTYSRLAESCIAHIRRLKLQPDETVFRQIFGYTGIGRERWQYAVLRILVWETEEAEPLGFGS